MLSREKTPSLCETIPAYNAIITWWKELQVAKPQFAEVIEAGIQKLAQYQSCLSTAPAYVLSICAFTYFPTLLVVY